MKYGFLIGLVWLGGLCPGLFNSLTAATTNSDVTRPNIIVVMTDDQGYGDIGLHGNDQIKTPHLDQFARDGIQMTRFYCSPVCAPTRACLMTGRYYYRTGVIHTSRGGAKMATDEMTIAELLRDAGYRTGVFGKWHLGDNYPMRPQDQGFDESLVHKSGGIGQTPDRPNSYFDPWLWKNGERIQAKGYCTDVFFDAATQFIEQAGREKQKPFFVYLPTNAPHAPLDVAEKYAAPYRALGLNDTTSRVYGMVANIDENFGRLLDKLDQLGIRDNTLVLFFTDNGPQQPRYNGGLRGRKSWVYEGGIRVPCFVQWPARLKGQRKIDRIAAHIDVLPTLLDASGTPIPKTLKLDGRSLLPLWDGRTTAWPDRQLFFQCHRGLIPRRYQNCAVVSQQFKMVGFPGTFSKEDLDTSGTQVLELYDLANDPGEEHDLAAARSAMLETFRSAYDRWYDSVRNSRHFQPGVIRIGSDAEDPTHLCRYQDGNYRQGVPHGWTVEVLKTGRYKFAINRGDQTGATVLHVTWRGQHQRLNLDADQAAAVVTLSRGSGVLDVWIQRDDTSRVVISDNSTAGDVTLTRLE